MSENADLLQALIDGDPSYTKDTNSRNSTILKSIINNTEYNDPPQSEIEELLLELKEMGIGGSVPELLVYGHQDKWDDGGKTETGSLVPLTLDEHEDFSTYLEYIPPTEGDTVRSGTFKVLKPFYGVIVPWVTNAKSSGGPPREVLYYNGDNYNEETFSLYNIDYFITDGTGEGAVGGFVPLTFNFKKDDVFGLTATNGTGYPKCSLKIYKFFDVSASTEAFFDSITEYSVL